MERSRAHCRATRRRSQVRWILASECLLHDLTKRNQQLRTNHAAARPAIKPLSSSVQRTRSSQPQTQPLLAKRAGSHVPSTQHRRLLPFGPLCPPSPPSRAQDNIPSKKDGTRRQHHHSSGQRSAAVHGSASGMAGRDLPRGREIRAAASAVPADAEGAGGEEDAGDGLG